MKTNLQIVKTWAINLLCNTWPWYDANQAIIMLKNKTTDPPIYTTDAISIDPMPSLQSE